MTPENYVISSNLQNMGRFEMCLWQSVLCETNFDIEITPRKALPRCILALQSFISFMTTTGGIIFIYDWTSKGQNITTFN